jgi:hypothetical protein
MRFGAERGKQIVSEISVGNYAGQKVCEQENRRVEHKQNDQRISHPRKQSNGYNSE